MTNSDRKSASRSRRRQPARTVADLEELFHVVVENVKDYAIFYPRPGWPHPVTAGRFDDERWHVRKDGTELWVTGVLTALRDPRGLRCAMSVRHVRWIFGKHGAEITCGIVQSLGFDRIDGADCVGFL